MVPTALWPFKKCLTAVQMATVAITSGHNVVVAILFEMVANPVHISSRISCVFAVFIDLPSCFKQRYQNLTDHKHSTKGVNM